MMSRIWPRERQGGELPADEVGTPRGSLLYLPQNTESIFHETRGLYCQCSKGGIVYENRFQYFKLRQHLSFEPVNYFWNKVTVTREMLTW